MSENAQMQYIGPDWRTALKRNVTVSLEFALNDMGNGKHERAATLIEEALGECNRLLSEARRVPS
jgi:hypothetical protein